MQTNIIKQYLNTSQGQEADQIIRSCVHCGFCTATCPTYQLLGDELDSPRGRIYLIKQMLEGNDISAKTQMHLDRCLTCRACETTCPSGVHYARLVDIGREMAEQHVKRPLIDQLIRYILRQIIPYPTRFKALVKLGSLFKPVLPSDLKKKIPVLPKPIARPTQKQTRSMLVLEGCAQRVVTPETNAATARILNRIGIELVSAPKAGCCGAVSLHLLAIAESLDFIRQNIDAWWPHIEQGAEAIIITASGCGTTVKDYGYLLKDDPGYAVKAQQVAALAKDISEVLQAENIADLQLNCTKKIAFHSPCTLQHGQQLNGVVESILTQAGFTLTEVTDPHLCCGSAGTYSILQSKLSQQLLNNKLNALKQGQPDVIATANIGCQMHLSSQADVPVKHWIELLDEVME